MTRLNATLLIGTACLMFACASEPKLTPEDAMHRSMDELRAAATTTIKDPARAREMASLVDQLERQFDEALKANRAHLDRLHSLDANYDATEGDFRKLFADFNAGRARRQDRVAELRDSMITATTPAEWSELAKVRVRARESMVKPR